MVRVRSISPASPVGRPASKSVFDVWILVAVSGTAVLVNSPAPVDALVVFITVVGLIVNVEMLGMYTIKVRLLAELVATFCWTIFST